MPAKKMSIQVASKSLIFAVNSLLFALWGLTGCGSNEPKAKGVSSTASSQPAVAQVTSAPAPSGSTMLRSHWPYADKQDVLKHGRIEAIAQKSDPCASGYFMRCSDNTTWFNCSCDDAKGMQDPTRPYWTQVTENEYLGKMWLYVSNDLSKPLVVGARQKQWDSLQQDVKKQTKPTALFGSLRITQRGSEEDWEVVAHVGKETCTLNYDGNGKMQKKRCEEFIPH